jgi:hypothetical protein
MWLFDLDGGVSSEVSGGIVTQVASLVSDAEPLAERLMLERALKVVDQSRSQW